MGTMMSAASSTERFPAPVPIGGTVRLVNSHSCACSSVERHARATPSRVTGSVSLWITAWMTNSAGRSPPPAVTTPPPPPRPLRTRSPPANALPPTALRRGPQARPRSPPQPAARKQHAGARGRLAVDRVDAQRALVILLRRAVVRRACEQAGPLDQQRNVVRVRRERVVEGRLGHGSVGRGRPGRRGRRRGRRGLGGNRGGQAGRGPVP